MAELLRTNYVDDILDTSKNTLRKYNMITNSDGTVSFEDVTEYKQVGDSFGSAIVNAQNTDLANIKEDISELNSNFDATFNLNDAIAARMAKHIITLNKKHLISIEDIGLTSIRNVKLVIDAAEISDAWIPFTSANYRVMKISVGTNPNTSKRTLIVYWYADGREYTSYLDFTN